MEAGHSIPGGILEVIPWTGEEFADREKQGKPFWENQKEEGGKDTEKKKDETVTEKPSEKKDVLPDDTQSTEKSQSAETQEKADTETIRVLLLGTGNIWHKKIILKAGEELLEITADSPYFEKTGTIRIRIAEHAKGEVEVISLDKACGHPSYGGILEIRKEQEGLVLINEVLLEEYVKGVLPSEMPSSYPLEALKAQAVCARTYAEMKQENKVYPQYDAAVDDSTACQVYRNLETSAQGNLAVEETAGEVLRKEDGGYQECYYYSTSCGRGTQISVWHGGEEKRPAVSQSGEEIDIMNQDFFDYISQTWDSHLESEEAFYRWNYRCEKVDVSGIFERCKSRQTVNDKLVWAERSKDFSETEISKKKLGSIRDMSIAARQTGGVADCLKITCEKGCVYVWGEYNIRYVLAQGGAARLQGDMDFAVKQLLPSAFISLQSICNEKGNMVGYIVVGGGFGHGVGMSQNGAKYMALAGNSYQEILSTYYGNL